MRAARQIVGGPRDGQTITVREDTSPVFFAANPPKTAITWDGPSPSDTIDICQLTYSDVVAPTGERVLLAPDVAWPDRFDTEAWPRRAATSVVTARGGPWADRQPIDHWRRLGPWLWRGDTCDSEHAHDYALQRYVYTVYLLGVPEPHPGPSRHDLPQRFDWVTAYALSHDVEPRELVLAAIAGQRTAEDQVIDQLRHQADELRTPWCPQPMCSRKATMPVNAWGPKRDPDSRMCPEHAHQEMQRFDRHYVQSWGVTNPVSAFRITNLGT